MVKWPGGRDVPVELLILPDLDRSALRKAAPLEDQAGPPVEEISEEDTESPAALQKFFSRLTRSADKGEVRRASCLRRRKEEIFELLKIEGRPKTIVIALPADD